MAVPKAEHLAFDAAMPALAMAGAAAAQSPFARPTRSPGRSHGRAGCRRPSSMNDWLEASMSKIGLAPLSLPAIPKRPYLPSALDDAADSKPYVLEKPDRRDAACGTAAGRANVVLAAWRHEVGVDPEDLSLVESRARTSSRFRSSSSCFSGSR